MVGISGIAAGMFGVAMTTELPWQEKPFLATGIVVGSIVMASAGGYIAAIGKAHQPQ